MTRPVRREEVSVNNPLKHETPPGSPGKRPKKDNRNIFNSGRFRFSVMYALVAVLLIVTIRQFTSQPAQTLTYSQLLNAVQSGKIATIAIGETQIEGRYQIPPDSLRGANRFTVDRVKGHEELISLLEEHNVDYYGVIPILQFLS